MPIINCPNPKCQCPQSDLVEFCIACGTEIRHKPEGIPDILSQLFGIKDKEVQRNTAAENR